MRYIEQGKKVRIGVVGCGAIGKRHIGHIIDNPECELAALCDILPVEELGVEGIKVPFYKSMDTMLSAGLALDLIVIATPNGLHAEQSINAIENGSHVIIEKPMGLTKLECERIINASFSRSKLVFCVMQNRFSPPSKWLKQTVESGILGKIFFVIINCLWNRDNQYYQSNPWRGTRTLDGGCLFTQFSHFIDIMYWVFGDIYEPVTSLQNFTHVDTTEFDDSGMVTFKFKDGGMGSINFSTSVYEKNFESSITIVAENGSIKIGGQYMNEIEYCNIKDYTLPELPKSNPPNDYGRYKGSAANHSYVIQNSIDTLKGRTTISTNALEGMKVVEIIEKIYQAGNKK